MNQIIKNFNKMFEQDDLFIKTNDTQISKLKNLFGTSIYKVIDFYYNFQPNNIPMLESYVQLLGIDSIIVENINAEPGKYLAEYGVFVFALTVGGNVLCIDTNDVKNGDPSILIADSNFCSYNEFYKYVEIGIVPDEIYDQIPENQILYLNYPNIKKCLKKVESSFLNFMLKLSSNYYDDIEEHLE